MGPGNEANNVQCLSFSVPWFYYTFVPSFHLLGRPVNSMSMLLPCSLRFLICYSYAWSGDFPVEIDEEGEKRKEEEEEKQKEEEMEKEEDEKREEKGEEHLAQVASTWPRVASTWARVASTWPGVASTWPGVASTWPGVASTWPGMASFWFGFNAYAHTITQVKKAYQIP